MSAERPRPEIAYGLTDEERLFDRISDRRFKTLLEDTETRVHKISVSSNTFGEFLFISTSHTVDDTCYQITFWGCGYHEYRERWITDEWYWYISYSRPDDDEPILTKEAVTEALQDRMEEIAANISHEPPSKRAQLFEMLADLTDEDGAMAELDDLSDLFDLFDD